MSYSFEEDALRFEFTDEWKIIKLDDHPYYRQKAAKLQETKAVDFIGLYQHQIYLVEIKDFRGYRIQNKERLSGDALATEFAQKVRDSLAVIIGAYRDPVYSDEMAPFISCLANSQTNFFSILWLEQDLPHYSQARHKAKLSVNANSLKKKLDWLRSRSQVWNCDNNSLPNCRVTNLPRSAS